MAHMHPIPEEELLAEFRDRATRDRAFTRIVQQYQQQVYFYVRRMVLDHDDANDVTQNVFIKAWKGLDQFKGNAKLSTWLYRIATNESITFINRSKRLAGIPMEEIEERLDGSLEADAYFDGDEIQRKLQTAVALLPEKQKAVFILKYFEDKKYQEMADITGTSVGALKASYHHAVQKIEKFLRRE